MASISLFDGAAALPAMINEPVKSYAPGSPERASIKATLKEMAGQRIELPCVIAGREVLTGRLEVAVMPHRHAQVLADAHLAGPNEIQAAIASCLSARHAWAAMPWPERAAIFLRAADLLSGPWRDTLNAATMLGQSKTVHQAEIDAAAELADFFRFNALFLKQLYEVQPLSSAGSWNRVDYRPLDGFIYAVTPFNFTSIAGNLPAAPALCGNTVLWKPSAAAKYSAHFVMALLRAAGLPDGVINLVYGDAEEVTAAALNHPMLAGIHFTGSTAVFQSLQQRVGQGRYRGYPRLVGETGGKNFILAHSSADAAALATSIVRGAFEYQGQKCSAASRLYIPSSLWPEVCERVKRSRFTEEQIIGVLKEHEAGVKTADLCRKHGVSQATFFKWKAKFGGMDVSDARKLKALEDENRKLKKLLAETMLDVAMLKDLNSKNGDARCEAAGRGSSLWFLRGEPAAGVPGDWG